LGNHQFKN